MSRNWNWRSGVVKWWSPRLEQPLQFNTKPARNSNEKTRSNTSSSTPNKKSRKADKIHLKKKSSDKVSLTLLSLRKKTLMKLKNNWWKHNWLVESRKSNFLRILLFLKCHLWNTKRGKVGKASSKLFLQPSEKDMINSLDILIKLGKWLRCRKTLKLTMR